MTVEAHDLMTRDVVTLLPDDTLADAARKLAERGISAAPVCDRSGALVGMVSEGDLMRPFTESNELRRAWWLSLLAEGTSLAPDFLEHIRRDHVRVDSLMTQPVITASESASLAELAETMTRHRIKRLPVLNDGRLVGIVSRADLVRALTHAAVEDAEPM